MAVIVLFVIIEVLLTFFWGVYIFLYERSFFMNRKHKTFAGVLWPFATIIYLLLSYITGRWDISWIVFLIPIAVQTVYVYLHGGKNS